MQNDIHNICEYHPFRAYGQRNPNFNRESGLLLDLKNPMHPNHKNAVKYFSGKVGNYLIKSKLNVHNCVAAIVPSSTAGVFSAGLLSILQSIDTDYKLNIQPLSLRRTINITPLHSGGVRNPSIHFGTIAVDKTIIKNGCRVLLLDDITTTGGSLEACGSLLIAAGAIEVIALAIGKSSYV